MHPRCGDGDTIGQIDRTQDIRLWWRKRNSDSPKELETSLPNDAMTPGRHGNPRQMKFPEGSGISQ